MSAMTLYLLCAACFVGGLAAGVFVGWMLGHDEGVEDGIMMSRPKERRWAI